MNEFHLSLRSLAALTRCDSIKTPQESYIPTNCENSYEIVLFSWQIYCQHSNFTCFLEMSNVQTEMISIAWFCKCRTYNMHTKFISFIRLRIATNFRLVISWHRCCVELIKTSIAKQRVALRRDAIALCASDNQLQNKQLFFGVACMRSWWKKQTKKNRKINYEIHSMFRKIFHEKANCLLIDFRFGKFEIYVMLIFRRVFMSFTKFNFCHKKKKK